MGTKQSIILPSKAFSSKGEAKDFFKAMLHRYHDGEIVNVEDGRLLFEYLQRHPNSERKIGVGVKEFFRAPSPDHPTSCFHLRRIDGFCTDFSLEDCRSGIEPTADQYFYSACRTAVSPHLTEKKNKIFDSGPVHCASSGALLTKENSEYRHTSPRFIEIVNRFKQEKVIIPIMEMVTESRDMQYSVHFSDHEMASAFLDFYLPLANLDIFGK